MSLQGLCSPNDIPLTAGDFAKKPNVFHESNAVENMISSPPQFHVDSNRGVRQFDEDAENRVKNVTKHSTQYCRTYPRFRNSAGSSMGHPEIPSIGDASSNPRAHCVKRSVSHKQAIRCSSRGVDFQRQEEKRSSKQDSRRSRGTALVTKPKSKFRFVNEKLGQNSLARRQGGKRPAEGRVFGFVFFKGNTGMVAETKIKKEEKKDMSDKKDRKETRHKMSKKNTKEGKKKSGKKREEKRIRHHSEPKKSKLSDGDRYGKANKSRAKESKDKNRKNCKRARSKNMKALCEFEISQKKKGSGLVVKVRGKRS